MNTAQALSKAPREKCLDAISAYLVRCGYRVTLASLEAEANFQYSGDQEEDEVDDAHEGKDEDASDTVLMQALMQYEERTQAFKGESQSKHLAQIEEMMVRKRFVALASHAHSHSLLTLMRPHPPTYTHPRTPQNTLKITRAVPATRTAYTLQPHVGNIIAAQLCPTRVATVVASGGVDKMVRITEISTQRVLKTVFVSAPVLCLDYHRTQSHLLLCGAMNGQVVLIDASTSDDDAGANDDDASTSSDNTTGTSGNLLQALSLHTKYTVAVKWSPDGTRAASASHDGKVHILRLTTSTTTSAPTLEVEHVQEYTNAVETIAWLDASHVLICPREDNYIHVFDVTRKVERCRINVNASGDDHVSFSCMHMSVSPDGQMIAVASDQHRLIVFAARTARRHRGGIALRTNSEVAVVPANDDRRGDDDDAAHALVTDGESVLGIQMRNYYGLQNDGFSNPRTAWSPDSRYVYVSSQDRTVCVYDVGVGRPVRTLRGHDVNVRDVASHPTIDALLVTCSFDKTVRVWMAEEEGGESA